MEKKKKIFGPIEIFAFLATVGILAYIVLKGGGGSILERTETVEITDNPNFVGSEKKAKEYRADEEESVEMILEQIADQYSNDTPAQSTQKQLKNAGMSKDELKYLEEVKQKKKVEKKDDSLDWFSILRTSHKTYSNVKSAFEKAGINVESVEGNVASKLVDEVAARSFYNKLEEMFDIPSEDARAFAEKGEKAVSDWARFVEEETKQ